MRGKLNSAQQDFVIRCLAVGFSLRDTCAYVKDEFDITVSPQNIKYYADTYPDRIREVRSELLADLQQIPFASKLTRVATLDRMARRLMRRGMFAEARATLKQIAEECGQIEQNVNVRDARVVAFVPAAIPLPDDADQKVADGR